MVIVIPCLTFVFHNHDEDQQNVFLKNPLLVLDSTLCHLHFEIPLKTIEKLKKEANRSYSFSPIFKTSVKNEKGETILELEKVLYIKKSK
mgnify:CR=1 FL=1